MNKYLLSITIVLISMFVISVYSQEYIDALSKVELYINKFYPKGTLANKVALKKLDEIYKKETTEKEKINELKNEFPKAFGREEKPLIFTKPVSWNIHSLSLGYDIQESASSKIQKIDIYKYITTTKDSSENITENEIKSKTNVDNNIGAKNEISLNPLSWIQALFSTNVKLAGSYTYGSATIAQKSDLWSKSQQEIFSRESNQINEMLKQTNIKNFHLTFTVTVNNNSQETIFCDLTDAYIPVYKGETSLNQYARPFNVKGNKLEIPPKRFKDIIFRMELDNTTTRSLVSFMENNSPKIDILNGGNFKIKTSNGADAIELSREKIVTSRIELILPNFSGKWNIRRFHTSNNQQTTLKEGLFAINNDFNNSILEANLNNLSLENLNVFNIQNNNLISISKIPLGEFYLVNPNCNYITLLQIKNRIYDSIDSKLLNGPIPINDCIFWVIDLNNIANYQNVNTNLKKTIFCKIKEEASSTIFSPKNLQAKYILGQMYLVGFNSKVNEKEAMVWFTKAAQQGEEKAQYILGDYYDKINNYKEAFRWYLMAAKQGVAGAEFSVGAYYFDGDGVEKDYKEAVIWYKKAAKKGYVDAQRDLAYCYENGLGVQKNQAEAKKWYREAAKQGDKTSQTKLRELNK